MKLERKFTEQLTQQTQTLSRQLLELKERMDRDPSPPPRYQPRYVDLVAPSTFSYPFAPQFYSYPTRPLDSQNFENYMRAFFVQKPNQN